MLKALSSAALVALIASGASSYYVAHAPNNKTSMVTENRPDGKTMVQVGRAHKSRDSAEGAMKAASGCATKSALKA